VRPILELLPVPGHRIFKALLNKLNQFNENSLSDFTASRTLVIKKDSLYCIDSLEIRRLRFDINVAYKILFNMIDVSALQFFTPVITL